MSDESDGKEFLPIGSLTSEIDSTPTITGTMTSGSRSNARSSSTGTERRAPYSLTVTRRGKHGLAARLTSLREMASTGRDPEATDRTLRALLAPLVRLSPKYDFETDDPYWMAELVSCDAEGDVEAAAEAVGAAMAPMRSKDILAGLVRLRALTVTRASAESDMALMLAGYVEALADQPGDALHAALRAWPRRNKFWPALAEIIEATEAITRERRIIAAALARPARERPTAVEQPRVPPTDAEIEAIWEKHGGRPKASAREMPTEAVKAKTWASIKDAARAVSDPVIAEQVAAWERELAAS